MNAVMKYPGAKWALAEWIIAHFPSHHSYLEPYFGSGAVLFRKPRSHIETVNDLDGHVVNLFRWIRDDPERLARAVYWTPYAREAYHAAFADPDGADSLKRAVDFYTRLMMDHGYRTTGERVGWKRDAAARERAYAAEYWKAAPETIMRAAERLRGVQIECRPAVELIRAFNQPSVLIYADPPYLLSTRRGKQYRHEMTDADHLELLDALKAHRGPVLLSGYDSGLYQEALKGWHREVRTALAQDSTRREEILWMNFEPSTQENLFREERLLWQDC